MIRRGLSVLAALTLAFVVGASPASAHASLQETRPGADDILRVAPEHVVLRFDEPVDARLGGISVYGPAGARIDDGAATSSDDGRTVRARVDAEPQGSYLVEWSVVSDDGHLLEGSFVFSVGRVSSVATPGEDGRPGVRALAGAARAVAYAGVLTLVGVLVIALLGQLVSRRRLAWTALGGAVAVACSSAVLLLTQSALASGRSLARSPALLDAALDTRTGRLLAARLALAVTAGSLALLWLVASRWWAALSVPVVGLVAVISLGGHAWTTSPTALAVGVDMAHLLATGVWIGGLAALTVAGAAPLVTRLRAFSPVAVWALLATTATGAVSSWLQTRSLDAVTDTGYGQLLVLKVALVAAAVVVATFVRRRLHAGDASAARLLGAELGAAALVLVTTAALVNQPPARDALVRPISVLAESTGDLRGSVEVQITPARTGANDIHLYFYDRNGTPRNIDVAELTVARPGQPARRLKVTPVSPQHVSAYGATFPSAGVWELVVTSLAGGRQSAATVEVRIR